MRKGVIAVIVVPAAVGTVVACIAVGTLLQWFEQSPVTTSFEVRRPGQDHVPPDLKRRGATVSIGARLTTYPGVVEELVTGEWPCFRGVKRNNICADGVPLLENFPAAGPATLWQVSLGEGHAAPVIAQNRVYLLDYLEGEGADGLRCFSLLRGTELWRRWYQVEVKRNHGYSRTIPAVSDGYVVTLGPKGHVMACRAETGELVWTMDLVADHGSEIPQWYAGQCPLIVDGQVLLAPAGPAVLMLAVELSSGKISWKAPNPSGLRMSHSSIVPMTVDGEALYVYAGRGGVVGVSPEGTVRFSSTEWSPSVVAPSPVPVGQGRLFVCAGYGAGGMLLRVARGGAGFVASIEQQHKPKDGFCLEQQSAIYLDGLLYGVLPKDAGARRGRFVVCRPESLSTYLAVSEEHFGLGPFIAADGKFFVLKDEGTLFLLRHTDRGLHILGQHRVLTGSDAWGPMALAGGLLLLRDSETMVCLDVSRDGRWQKK